MKSVGVKLINVDKSINYKFLAYFVTIDLCRVDPTTSIQEQKYAKKNQKIV